MTLTVPDAYLIFKRIENLIRTVPSFGQRVYTGGVPGTVPDVGGHVLPYCVLWPSTGTPHGQEPVGGGPDRQGQVFRFMTTTAAADVWAVVGATDQLKATLTGAKLGRDTGLIRPVELQQRAAIVAKDPDSNPPRFGVALAWTLATTTNPEE
jgi:hypothetical protein